MGPPRVASLFGLTVLLAACGGPTTPAPIPPAAPSAPPNIVSFTASPSTVTTPGQAVTLSWQVSGDGVSLQLADSFSGVTTPSGTSATVDPTGTTVYRLTATNAAGSAFRELSVTLSEGAPPEPEPDAPRIVSFTANPTATLPDQSVTLSWAVSGEPTGLSIDNGVGAVGGSSVIVTPTATTAYTLTATNAAGRDSEVVTVTVAAPSEPDPAPEPEPAPPAESVPYEGEWVVRFDNGSDGPYFFLLDVDEPGDASFSGQGRWYSCLAPDPNNLCSALGNVRGSGHITDRYGEGDPDLSLLTVDGGHFLLAEQMASGGDEQGRDELSGYGSLGAAEPYVYGEVVAMLRGP